MSNVQKYKKWIILLVSLLTVTILYYYFFNIQASSELVTTNVEGAYMETNENYGTTKVEQTSEKIEASTIIIDVKGAVQKPGVYEISANARVHEIIEKAGGLSDQADEAAVNLASSLEDGMVVYIPLIGENKENPFQSTNENKDNPKKININLATSEELQTLSGIGPSKADAIISYREENGQFKSIEGLLEVSGIGEKSLEKLKEEVTVN
ncbi:helix-hairpin-helix domain-containing protein [Metabacillus endolithicus]|uniref:Helix-hairpin-helix domain-containing protein n=1 Tax=Metabacillus endolithicus TaxID=1535204 RepID=A0ABW5BWA6_9BACI|nr:helix-hairpin-helix domain-containing protein [Metabacillus endolithicus]UPG64614.1 helix-hairpin-helix domain-containing protein [Metabacillus endolithicus]